MISARQQERLELMKKLRKIEKEHKSITNLPSNDPRIKELQSLTKREKKKRPKYVATELDEIQRMMVEDAICGQLRKGYSVKQIASQMGVSQFWVRSTAKKRSLKVIKPFRYKIINESGVEIYTSSKEAILRYFGWRYHNVNCFDKYVSKECEIVSCKYLWGEIPQGAKYILKDAENKHGFVLRVK